MRQLDVLDKTRGVHVVAVQEHKFGILRRADDGFVQFLGTEGAIRDGHGQRLALVVAENQPVAPREARRAGRPGVAAHGFAFGQLDFADNDIEAELFGEKRHFHPSPAQFSGEGMHSAEAALRGVGHAEQKPFVGAGQRLKAHAAIRRGIGGACSRTSHQGSVRRGDPSMWRKCAAARAWLTCPRQANCRTGEAWSGRHGRGIRLRASRPAPA